MCSPRPTLGQKAMQRMFGAFVVEALPLGLEHSVAPSSGRQTRPHARRCRLGSSRAADLTTLDLVSP